MTADRTAAPAVAFPETPAGTDQDAETVWIDTADGWREIRLHDYAEVFAVPGLYEKIFSDTLDCMSPRIVVDHLVRVLDDHGCGVGELTALDFGAGNGLVGEQLSARGATDIVGLDRIPEAAAAARRDRPGVYRDYLVGDIADPDTAASARAAGANLLVCVAALGFDDIPVEGFMQAVRTLRAASWVAFNIKTEFLAEGDPGGFADRLTSMTTSGEIVVVDRIGYVHRRARSGSPLHYTSIVARTPGPQS